MPPPSYRLTPEASSQLEEILYSLAEYSGWERSMDLEEKFYAAFQDIGRAPGIGHTRPDLLTQDVFFFLVDPYFVIYRKAPKVIYIIAIWHTARDIPALVAGETP